MVGLLHGGTTGSLLLVFVVALGNVLAELSVSPDSTYCMQHPTFLSCNFLGAEETVVLEALRSHGGNVIRTVYVHNAQNMVVKAENLCVSFAAFSVANITYSKDPNNCKLDQQFSFKLVDSAINLVPSYISQLEMQRSAAKEIILDRHLKTFSVTGSDIGFVEVSEPIKGINIKVEHSTIDNLKKLHLKSNANLLLYNATINRLEKNSLYLIESKINIWKSNIKTSLAEAIVLGPKSGVIMKDTSGSITFAGLQELPSAPPPVVEQQELKPLGVPPSGLPKTPPCTRSSSLLWVFPMVVATVEAIIIIINCTNWFPAFKGRRVPHGLEEGRQPVRGESTYSYSTWSYNSEVTSTPTRRWQGTNFDKYK